MAECRFCQSLVDDADMQAHEDGAHPADVIAELRAKPLGVALVDEPVKPDPIG